VLFPSNGDRPSFRRRRGAGCTTPPWPHRGKGEGLIFADTVKQRLTGEVEMAAHINVGRAISKTSTGEWYLRLWNLGDHHGRALSENLAKGCRLYNINKGSEEERNLKLINVSFRKCRLNGCVVTN
jgi:hypothetical protein